MKKIVLILILLIIMLAAGCEINDAKGPLLSPITEESNIKPNSETAAENSENSLVESTDTENEGDKKDAFSENCITGRLDDYMASVLEQSEVIKASLEHDTLTQADMNIKSQELYRIWDDTLNFLWGEIKSVMSEEEYNKLLDEQLTWIAEKEKAVEEAGKEFKGGSVYSLVVNSEAAKITEERVYELYELLKRSEIQ